MCIALGSNDSIRAIKLPLFKYDWELMDVMTNRMGHISKLRLHHAGRVADLTNTIKPELLDRLRAWLPMEDVEIDSPSKWYLHLFPTLASLPRLTTVSLNGRGTILNPVPMRAVNLLLGNRSLRAFRMTGLHIMGPMSSLVFLDCLRNSHVKALTFQNCSFPEPANLAMILTAMRLQSMELHSNAFQGSRDFWNGLVFAGNAESSHGLHHFKWTSGENGLQEAELPRLIRALSGASSLKSVDVRLYSYSASLDREFADLVQRHHSLTSIRTVFLRGRFDTNPPMPHLPFWRLLKRTRTTNFILRLKTTL